MRHTFAAALLGLATLGSGVLGATAASAQAVDAADPDSVLAAVRA